MIVNLITDKSIKTVVLPEKIKGKYMINDDSNINIVNIEGVEDSWFLKTVKSSVLLDKENKNIKSIELREDNIYPIFYRNSEKVSMIYVESDHDNKNIYNKWFLKHDMTITIGRAANSTIQFNNQFVSSEHATLEYRNNTFYIKDSDSDNGVFVNNIRISEHVLAAGDVIYIVGFKIIIGTNFIAVNNPDNQIVIKPNAFAPFFSEEAKIVIDEPDLFAPKSVVFHRSPIFKSVIKPRELELELPPLTEEREETPILLVLGPTVTMVLMSIFTAITSIKSDSSNQAGMIVMIASLIIGSILWPIITRIYDKKRIAKKENNRIEKYNTYLVTISSEINNEVLKQQNILNTNNPRLAVLANRVINKERELWERDYRSQDFLTVPLGYGTIPALLTLRYPPKRFEINVDLLSAKFYEFVNSNVVLQNVPVIIDLKEDKVVGIMGEYPTINDIAINLIMNLSILHSYDEVKMMFIYDKNSEMDFVKWLPHCWSNDKENRFIATDENEIKDLAVYLENEYNDRKAMSEELLDDVLPHYIIFSFDRELSNRLEILKQISRDKNNYKISFIAIYDKLHTLPKECTKFIEARRDKISLYDKQSLDNTVIEFVLDSRINYEEISIEMANINQDLPDSKTMIPDMVNFLEMFNAGKVEHLNILERWKENSSISSLATEVGIDNYGNILKLDLHEKYHGPHGLVAGMTGSGKSEFIMTYILSLAINYHPNEVSFILIDYKGGGMAKSFERLPHTAGVITNLDGNAINRSLSSIQSELKCRQKLFSEISRETNISNIDIYKYQKLYKEGVVSNPVPHLFIIADEFAELKLEQRTFMDKLISAARIGRSLGIHLILATQKPAGVVDDQIWSNSKFKVCLKVAEKADSMDMIKCPDAAYLTTVGRFYLQVGFNEIFEIGQSAWAGANYFEEENIKKDADDSIDIINRTGHVISKAKKDKRKLSVSPIKQLDRIVNHIVEIVTEEKIAQNRLWCDPLDNIIDLEEIRLEYGNSSPKDELKPIVGKIDDPTSQRQFELRLPIMNNTIIYGKSGSGKSLLLETTIISSMEEYTTKDINFYILDFDSEKLSKFAEFPYIGDVMTFADNERINNLFKMLFSTIDKRKKILKELSMDFSEIRETKQSLPALVVVIHNYLSFIENYPNLEDDLIRLSRECEKYGVYFMITVFSQSSIRARLAQNFSQSIALQLQDEYEYKNILGSNEIYPAKNIGRGLIKLDNIYEFQIATSKKDLKELKAACLKRNSGTKIDKVPTLPDVVSIKDVLAEETGNLIPIGIRKDNLEIYSHNFDLNLNIIYSNSDINALPFLDALVDIFKHKELSILDISTEAQVVDMYNDILARHKAYKEDENQKFKKQFYLIKNVTETMSKLSEDGLDKLKVAIEKNNENFNVKVIIYDAAQNTYNYSSEDWYTKQVKNNCAIWIGSGIAEQYKLQIKKISNDLFKNIDNNFGYALEEGNLALVKLVEKVMDSE